MKRSKKSISQTVRHCLSARELRWRAHQTHRHLQLCSLDPSDRRTDGQTDRGVAAFLDPGHTHRPQRKEQRQRSVRTNHLRFPVAGGLRLVY